jgi:hypothetical protein
MSSFVLFSLNRFWRALQSRPREIYDAPNFGAGLNSEFFKNFLRMVASCVSTDAQLRGNLPICRTQTEKLSNLAFAPRETR